MNKKDIIIFSRRIAKELIQSRKFELVDIGANSQFPLKTVYYFKDTQELRDYLETVHYIKID